MRLAHAPTDRHRRTEAVIEILRRRAELRHARGDAVSPALRKAIDEFDRHVHADRSAPKPGPR